ncbi:MAG: DUF6647 family protein [Cellvibrionaceae bacterium]
MEIVVAILIEWLALNTDVNLNSFPRVEVVRHSEMVDMSGMDAYGLYNWEEKKIYISNRVDLTRMQGISIVLHELIHHHQNVSGLLDSYDCKRQSEVLAYELQKQFLTSMNASLTLELDSMHVTMSSTCFASDSVARKTGSEKE